MQRGIEQIVRLLMVQVRCERRRGSGGVDGGLLVSVSADTSELIPEHLSCTVAATGAWFSGVSMPELKQEVEKRLPPSVRLTSLADPEELSVFTETCGPLHFHLSFQVAVGRQAAKDSFLRTQQFLHRLGLVHAQLEIHFISKVNEMSSRQVFSCRPNRRFPLEGGWVFADSALYLRCPLSLRPHLQCGRLHPVLGRTVSLLLPPEVAETGLCGETSLLPLAALSPCVAQFPNRATRFTHICVLLYGPSSVPLLCHSGEAPMGFLCDLAASLSWEQFDLSGVRCAERQTIEGSLCSEMVYAVNGQLQNEEVETVQSAVTEQTLILFLFIQHSDPFLSQLSDFIASEEILQEHLDQILQHNEDRVHSALCSLLQSTLKGPLKRQQAQRKVHSALPVILGSLCSVVTSSSSLDFRSACLDRMKARDTRELAICLDRSLQKVTEGRFLPNRKCDSSKSLLALTESEGVSDPGEERREGDLEKLCATPSHPRQEPFPDEPQALASMCRAGKRPWEEQRDSNPAPSKQRFRRSPGTVLCPLQPSQSAHNRPTHAAPHPGKENQQEDIFWLQEISNMSEWE